MGHPVLYNMNKFFDWLNFSHWFIFPFCCLFFIFFYSFLFFVLYLVDLWTSKEKKGSHAPAPLPKAAGLMKICILYPWKIYKFLFTALVLFFSIFYISIYLFIYLSIQISVYLSFVDLYFYPSIHLSIYISIYIFRRRF